MLNSSESIFVHKSILQLLIIALFLIFPQLYSKKRMSEIDTNF